MYDFTSLYRVHRDQVAAAAADKSERCWIRGNLSAEALEKFQATVHGIHRRFDEVMARCGK
ncbi:hypothetical protein [Stenotrophomonas sp. UBA7606]|uniref:hypothetical protein n=1 Tax=Stenotrophomonas sp. UBA7606 TaxID=1947559 RepID=UPI0025D7E59E|nr:hypothetical protein [Stenotrophomonas sp. UBA7606]